MTMSLLIASLALSAQMHAAVQPQPDVWESLGEWRITTYCECCNDPGGRISASGRELGPGCVAMNGVPLGSTISIEGEEYTVADRCGIDGTVDIWVETDGGCRCNYLDYKTVRIKEDKDD